MGLVLTIALLAAGCGVDLAPDEAQPPLWLSRHGSSIAYTDFDSTSIRLLARDGSRHTLARDAEHPAWSPDGTKIAFERVTGESSGAFQEPTDDIFVVNADGTGLVQLTAHPEEDHEPAWSPDGTRIAFSSRRVWGTPQVDADFGGGGNENIFVMNADGSGVKRITSSPASEYDAAWSPDGRRIAFGSGDAIWVMGADGSGRRQLTGGGADGEPAWSPNGKQIAFGSHGEIWLMDADGKNQHRVTRKMLDSDPEAGEPDWSLDGMWIVFETDYGEGIWLVRQDGTGLRQLINEPAYDPKWRPQPANAAHHR